MKWFLAVVACISLNSCIIYPSMHYSVAQNVPLFTQKDEARVTVATGNEAIGLQCAYAFSPSWAVMGSYSGGLDEFPAPDYSDGGFDNGTRWSSELAVGHFQPIGTKGIFEIYGGAERYYRSFTNSWIDPGSGGQNSSALSTYCTKPFVQLDLGSRNTGRHSFGLSLKLGLLMYDHFSYLTTDSIGKSVQSASSYNSSPALIVEPCFTYRLGGKYISFQAQAGLSITNSQVNNINSGSGLSEPFFFNLGLSVRLFKDGNYKAAN